MSSKIWASIHGVIALLELIIGIVAFQHAKGMTDAFFWVGLIFVRLFFLDLFVAIDYHREV